jgi:hypothetical protein
MIERTDHPAIKRLFEFFAKMCAWEVEAYRHYKSGAWAEMSEEQIERENFVRRKALESIYEDYCDAGKNAERLQDAGISYGDPPTYDPTGEQIVSFTEKRGKIIIESKENYRMKCVRKFELVEKDGIWRLRDSLKYKWEGEPSKWKKSIL